MSRDGVPELRLYQLLITKLLVELRRVCDLTDCKYFIIAGTLLGAKRHNGFIPWDTDIDVCMLRNDYDKFLIIAKNLLASDVMLEIDDNFERSARCFARIRLSGTQVSESGNYHHDLSGKHGFYLDIFPIDNYPYPQPTRAELFFHWIYRILVRLKAFKAGKRSSSKAVRTIFAYFIGALGLLIPYSHLHRWLDYWVKRFNDHEYPYVTNFNSKYGLKKQTMNVSMYGEGKMVLFESQYFRAPASDVEWLGRIYGNWSQLPHSFNMAPADLPSGYVYDFGKFISFLGESEEYIKKELKI